MFKRAKGELITVHVKLGQVFPHAVLEIHQQLISSAITLLPVSTVRFFYTCLQSVFILSTLNRLVSSRGCATALSIFLSCSFMYMLDRVDLLEHKQ